MSDTPKTDAASKLLAAGWREYPNQFKKYARCFYKQFDTPTRCASNDDKAGMQIEISVSEMDGVESYEMELNGELRDGTWLKLHQWAMPKSIEQVVALIPRMLATWEATNIEARGVAKAKEECAQLRAERDALRLCVAEVSALDNTKLALEALHKEHAAMRAFTESVASAVVMHADWSAGDCIKAEYVEEAKELLASIA